MKRCVKTDVMAEMMELLTGDAGRSLEAAKHLIAFPPSELEPLFLERVVSDPGYRVWSKVAAAYVLGFVPIEKKNGHEAVLRQTLADVRGSVRVRTHAAEALGNLRDRGSLAVLRERLLDSSESVQVRRWCIYALGEIGSVEAIKTLRSFAASAPRGVLAEELDSAGVQAA